MVGLAELARKNTTLNERSIDHLRRLVAAWPHLADLAFSDLLLYAPHQKETKKEVTQKRWASPSTISDSKKGKPGDSLSDSSKKGKTGDSRSEVGEKGKTGDSRSEVGEKGKPGDSRSDSSKKGWAGDSRSDSSKKGWVRGSASGHIAERSGAVTRNESLTHPYSQTRNESLTHPYSQTRNESLTHPYSQTRNESPAHPYSQTRNESPAHPYSQTRNESPPHPYQQTQTESPAQNGEAKSFVILAHIRANTGPTAHITDPVGTKVDTTNRSWLTKALTPNAKAGEVEIPIGAPPASIGDDTVMEDPVVVRAHQRCLVVNYAPVRCGNEPIAVLSREAAPASIRQPNPLEVVYRVLFDRFVTMISDGTFPYDRMERLGGFREPRVGDGVIVLNHERRIDYVSPNATSALHRLGVVQPLPGNRFSDLGLKDEVIRRSFWLRRSTVAEFHMGSKITVAARAFPLIADNRITGAVTLLRDVSELRRSDQLLMSKDATIGEIHHRVKNNLQTVSALLRLQSRRLNSPEVKAAMESSVRRVSSIAMVHEQLALNITSTVDFDSIVAPLARMVEEGLTDIEQPLRIEVEGTAGEVSGDTAMPLAVVLAELIQNAYDHSKPSGEVVKVRFDRTADNLSMRITDTGPGVPDGFSLDRDAGLGLTIVRTFVVHDLGGVITIRAASNSTPRGTVVNVTVPRNPPESRIK